MPFACVFRTYGEANNFRVGKAQASVLNYSRKKGFVAQVFCSAMAYDTDFSTWLRESHAILLLQKCHFIEAIGLFLLLGQENHLPTEPHFFLQAIDFALRYK